MAPCSSFLVGTCNSRRADCGLSAFLCRLCPGNRRSDSFLPSDGSGSVPLCRRWLLAARPRGFAELCAAPCLLPVLPDSLMGRQKDKMPDHGAVYLLAFLRTPRLLEAVCSVPWHLWGHSPENSLRLDGDHAASLDRSGTHPLLQTDSRCPHQCPCSRSVLFRPVPDARLLLNHIRRISSQIPRRISEGNSFLAKRCTVHTIPGVDTGIFSAASRSA